MEIKDERGQQMLIPFSNVDLPSIFEVKGKLLIKTDFSSSVGFNAMGLEAGEKVKINPTDKVVQLKTTLIIHAN
jgi:hypothetical protein